jgi:hypothetical protein
MVVEDDFTLVNRGKVERAFTRAKHLGDFGRQEVLQIVSDGLADASELFVGLGEETVSEVRVYGGAAGSFEQALKVLHFLGEKLAVGEQLESASQRDGLIQLE